MKEKVIRGTEGGGIKAYLNINHVVLLVIGVLDEVNFESGRPGFNVGVVVPWPLSLLVLSLSSLVLQL